MSVFPMLEIRVLEGGAFGRGLGREGGALVSGASALVKGASVRPLIPSPSEHSLVSSPSTTRQGALARTCLSRCPVSDLYSPEQREIIILCV